MSDMSGAPDAPSSSVPHSARCQVLIVTYRSADHVGRLLESLEQARAGGLELDVLVVDNDSDDLTTAVVRRHEGVRLVESGGNLGYAAAINIGLRTLDPGVPVLILNPDIVPGRGAVAELLAALVTSGAGVVVPRIEDASGELYPSLRNEPTVARALVDGLLGRRAARLPATASQVVWDLGRYEVPGDVAWATGAALLVAPGCLQAVGDWDERFFLYSEETDFLRRVRDHGWRLRYVPTAVVRHAGGGSGTSDALCALMVVNGVRYVAKYHGGVVTTAYTAAVALHQLVRIGRPSARLALRSLVWPPARRALPGPRPAGGPGAAA